MDIKKGMRRYAEVLVKIGVAPTPGQPICVEAPVEQSEFVAMIADAAYKAGCGKFAVLWKCDAVDRVKIDNQKFEQLECDTAVAEYYSGIGAGFIRLDSPDTETYAGVSTDKMNEKAVVDTANRKLFQKKAIACGQTIACVPCPAWANLVFPDLPEEKRMDALWEAVLKCMRCDKEDPVGDWEKYIADTTVRKKKLDEKHYKIFHYTSGKTDMTLCPVDNWVWAGGCIKIGERTFIPNLPTVEVFTTPHKYKANGHVASTLPLNYHGQLIENFVLTLKDGRIVDYHAEKGEELLRSIIETDEGSHYLGEMALVDQVSPIANMKRIFYTTLYDENASCHIAIGNAYGPSATPEEKDERGYNVSALHVDFMIGSDDMHIQAKTEDGDWEDVFVNGSWAPAFT